MAKIFWKGGERFSLLRGFGWLLEASLFRLLWACARPFSIDRASDFGRRVMSAIGPRSRKHKHILANLTMAFPDRSREEIECLGVEVWGNLGAVLVELAILDKLVGEGDSGSRVEIRYNNGDPGILHAGKPTVFVSAHCANWELLAATAGKQVGNVFNAVYSPQKNPVLEKLIQGKRQALGAGFVDKANGVRKLYKILRNRQLVGLVVDTRVDKGAMVPFFGVEAMTTTAPAWLSLKAHCDIVPVQVERLNKVNFRITLHQPLRTEVADNETEEQAILRVTGEINAAIESWIRAHPGQWLCSKRRWPKEAMNGRGAYA